MRGTEAQSRIKINRLLEDAGWRFFNDENGRANIQLEQGVTITTQEIDALGEDFENHHQGYIDFLLLNENSRPLVVLEAKREEKNPLDGKEQAREYAKSINVRYVILSNGNIHYFWDMEVGNPTIITQFPTQASLRSHSTFKPNPSALVNELVENDYITKTQKPDYDSDPRYIDEEQRSDFLKDNGLMLLRDYQLNAVKSIQKAVNDGNNRFLFEMATGTGKTLIAAAVIKLFLRTSNAKRVLFLVDRIELEIQAKKAFTRYLKNDYQAAIYKQARNNWNNFEIVVSTVQSLNDKYAQLFSPTDFDLIISDEAHRSIGGNARAVFEYFTGYKLGLTATPKDYLKNIDNLNDRDPREMERRLLLDTYKTFGCETGNPTFTYSLLNGFDDGYLINPIVADARTKITTKLLSDEGYFIEVENQETGEPEDAIYTHRDFERKFFSKKTNMEFCKTFMENALRDPISGEIGKTIMFCVSQKHASKITQILNEFAQELFPNKYNSDFAVQVTSSIPNAQQSTINFANNNLNQHTKWLDSYKSSKTRVCVTVGMMTTGYDCEDILNLCLMRPIFSPTDFVQIKGRGTRTFSFNYSHRLDNGEMDKIKQEKEAFKVFDFFANFEYFEVKYNYDEVLKVTITKQRTRIGDYTPEHHEDYISAILDPLKTLQVSDQKTIWKVDRMSWQNFSEEIRQLDAVREWVYDGNFNAAEKYVKEEIFDKPEEYYNLEKLQKAVEVDRKPTLKEMLERIFNIIPKFKSRDDLLNEECDKFISIYKPAMEFVLPIKNFLKTYITDPIVRDVIDSGKYADLATSPVRDDFKALNNEWRSLIPNYVKDYINLNQYA